MTAEAFVAELDRTNREALDRLGAAATAGEPAPGLTVATLRRLALKNEHETSEIAAIWIGRLPELHVKLGFARQAGDEAKHHRLIEERLGVLGVEPGSVDPLADGFETTVERVAAGQLTREAIALIRNEALIAYCEARRDTETARLDRETIQPDDQHHHELGRRLLLRYADTAKRQDAAREAAAGTLRRAEEIQETARLSRGISRAPGC